MATPTNLPASQTTGNVLTAAYMNDLRGAFRVLQVASVQASTQETTTSATYSDVASMTITITPQSTTNKILIVATNNFIASSANADVGVRFLRNGTTTFTSVQGIFASNTGGSVTSIYLDSPASTSALTYKVQFNRNYGTGLVYSNAAGTASNLLIMEISA